MQINYWNEKEKEREMFKEEQEEEKKEALFCVCVYLHFEIIWIQSDQWNLAFSQKYMAERQK